MEELPFPLCVTLRCRKWCENHRNDDAMPLTSQHSCLLQMQTPLLPQWSAHHPMNLTSYDKCSFVGFLLFLCFLITTINGGGGGATIWSFVVQFSSKSIFWDFEKRVERDNREYQLITFTLLIQCPYESEYWCSVSQMKFLQQDFFLPRTPLGDKPRLNLVYSIDFVPVQKSW